jgi:hypothetical protein
MDQVLFNERGNEVTLVKRNPVEVGSIPTGVSFNTISSKRPMKWVVPSGSRQVSHHNERGRKREPALSEQQRQSGGVPSHQR